MDTQVSFRNRRKWALVTGVAALVAAGGVAIASAHHHGHGFAGVARHIDAALDAVQATPAQRDAIHAARDHVVSTMQAGRAAHQAQLAQALTLWESDHVDAAQLAALRSQHRAQAKATGDAIVQALSDAHDALTAPQRAQLATWMGAHRPPTPAMIEGAKPLIKHGLGSHVDDLLDQIHATAAQRDQVHAAVDQAFASVRFDDHAALFDQLVGVITADQLDRGKLTALETQVQDKMQQVGDAMTTALTSIHDTLDAGQRKQVADFIREHHAHHGG